MPTRVDEAGLAELFARAEAQAAAQSSESAADDAAGHAGQPDTESESTEAPRPGAEEGADTQEDGYAAPAAETDETAADSAAEEAAGSEESEQGEEQAGKGVRRLLRQNAALKAEIAKLREQVGEAAKPNEPAPQEDTFSDHPDIAAMDAEAFKAEKIIKWLEDHPEGGELNGVEIVAEHVPGMISHARKRVAALEIKREVRQLDLAKEAKARQARAQAEAQAAFPRMFQADTLEHKTALEVLATLPTSVRAALQRVPDANVLLGDLVTGRLSRLNNKANPLARSGGERPTPPRVTVGRGSAPAPAPNGAKNGALQRQFEAAAAAYRKSGSVEDLARVEALREQMMTAANRR